MELTQLYRQYLRVASRTPWNYPQEERCLFRSLHRSGKRLNDHEILLVIRALSHERRIWFAYKVCRVLETVPTTLFDSLIEASLSNPSHFIRVCVRLFGVVKVNDALLGYIACGKKIIKAVDALYYTVDLPSTWSESAAEYVWDLALMKATYPRSIETGIIIAHNVYPEQEYICQKRYKTVLKAIIDNEDSEIRRSLRFALRWKPLFISDELRALERQAQSCMRQVES